MKLKVLLYIGAGAYGYGPHILASIIAKQNDIELMIINEKTIDVINFGEYHCIIFPGGNAYDLKKNLKVETVANIKKAISEGLGYFGICAGAYLALNKEYGINLVDVYHDCYDECAIINLEFDNKYEVNCIYDQGPIFDSEQSKFAIYKTDIGKLKNKSAIIQKKLNKGIIILCGPHIEQMPILENYVLYFIRYISIKNY